MTAAVLIVLCVLANVLVSSASRELTQPKPRPVPQPEATGVWDLKPGAIVGCPKFEDIVISMVNAEMANNKLLAAGLLRLAFHDCAVNGCDGSVLLTAAGSEKFATPNTGLVGHDLLDRIKEAVDVICPRQVSCADLLQSATRAAVEHVGGGRPVGWPLKFGRKDGSVSTLAAAAAWLPPSRANVKEGGPQVPGRNATMSLTQFFEILGLSVQEMVTLSGAHTLGKSRCAPNSERLTAALNNTPANPMAEELRSFLNRSDVCRPGSANAANITFKVQFDFNGNITAPSKEVFDNSYWKQLSKKWGLLNSDQSLYTTLETRDQVNLYAANEQAFFADWAKAMTRMTEIMPGNLVQKNFPLAPKVPVYPGNVYGIRAGKCSEAALAVPPAPLSG